MDTPKIFTTSESTHRIHNPFTVQKYTTLSQVLWMPPGTCILDLDSDSGEMLCTWTRDHRVSDVGINMSQLSSEQTTLRASGLGVTKHVRFTHADVTGYITEEKFDIATCIGATWIAGGVAGTTKQLEQSLKPSGILPIGEPHWRQIPTTEEIAMACDAVSVADFLSLPELVSSFDLLGYGVVEMVLTDQKGWDRYGATKWLTMHRWLEANPDDEFVAEVREQLRGSPVRHVAFTRGYIGWGVFALMQR